MSNSKAASRKLLLTLLLAVVFACQLAILSFVDLTPVDDVAEASISTSSLHGTVLTLPTTLVEVSTGESVQVKSDSMAELRVLVLLALRCAQCMEDLDKWKDFEVEMRERAGITDERALSFIFVVDGLTRKYASYMLSRREFDYPVLFDSLGTIVSMNGLPGAPAAYLLDASNRVLEVGIPVAQPLVKELYLSSAAALFNE